MRRDMKRREALIGLAAGAGLLAAGETALAQSGPYKESPALAEQVKAGKLPPVEHACRRSRWWCRWSRRSASMAACGAGRSSGRPMPTTTSASSMTRCSASRPTAPRSSPRSPRAPSPRPTSRPGRSSCARARTGRTASPSRADDILFWYNDVLLNKELTPTLPGWIKNPDGSAGQGREGRRHHGALHLRRAGDAVPHRGRQPGRRRPHLRDVPAGALPQEVPSGPCRQGGHRQGGAGGGLQDLDRAVRQQERAARKPRTPDHGGLGADERGPAIRCSRCGATPTMSASTRPATSCPISTRCASPTSPTRRRSTSPPSPATSTCRNATST